MNNFVSGISQQARLYLARILYSSPGVFTSAESRNILGVSAHTNNRVLSYLSKHGWIIRLKQGLYMPVPIAATHLELAIESPFLIAHKEFSPSYIGGWSAIDYYSLSDQIFMDTIVLTERKLKCKNQKIGGAAFITKKIPKNHFFGLDNTWVEGQSIFISDPTKTILDILLYPEIGGGVRNIVDILINYFNSEYKNKDKIIEYLKLFNIGSLYSRVGFLLEKFLPENNELIDICKKNLRSGYVYLDPNIKGKKLVTRWKIFINDF